MSPSHRESLYPDKVLANPKLLEVGTSFGTHQF
jgi:hypothetical protein